MKFNLVLLDEREREFDRLTIEADDSEDAIEVFRRDHPDKAQSARAVQMVEITENGLDADESVAILGRIWDEFRSFQRVPDNTPKWSEMTSEGKMTWVYWLRQSMQDVLEDVVMMTCDADTKAKMERN
jgi:hypothetical protein